MDDPPSQMLSPSWQMVRTLEAAMGLRDWPRFGSPKTTTERWC